MADDGAAKPKGIGGWTWTLIGAVLTLTGSGLGKAYEEWVTKQATGHGLFDVILKWLSTPMLGMSPFTWMVMGSIAAAVVATVVLVVRGLRVLDHMTWLGLRWEWSRVGRRVDASSVTILCTCRREIAPKVVDAAIVLRCEFCGTTCDLAGKGLSVASIPDLVALAARERDHRMRLWKAGGNYRRWAEVAKDSTHRPRLTSSFTQPTAGAPHLAIPEDAQRIALSQDPIIEHGQHRRQNMLADRIMGLHFPLPTDRTRVNQRDILRSLTTEGWPLDEVKSALSLLVETGRLARSGDRNGVGYHSSVNEVDWRTEFHGMRWRGVDWQWRVSASGDPMDIRANCPTCSTPLSPTNASGYDAVPLIHLTCDHCAKHIGPAFNGDGNALLLRMQAEMQRRINVCEKGGYTDAKAMANDDHEPIDRHQVVQTAAPTAAEHPASEVPALAGEQLARAKQQATAFLAHDILVRAFGGQPGHTIRTTVEIQEMLRGTGRSKVVFDACLDYLEREQLVTVLRRFGTTQVIATEAGQRLLHERLDHLMSETQKSVIQAAEAAHMAAYRVGSPGPIPVKPDASEPALTREILRHAFMGGNVGKPVFKDAAIAAMKIVGYEAPDVERVLSLMESKRLLDSVTSASNGTTQYSLTTAGEKRAKAGT